MEGDTFVLSVGVGTFLKEQQNILSKSSNRKEAMCSLNNIMSLIDIRKPVSSEYPFKSDRLKVRNIFLTNYYKGTGEMLLRLLTPEWMNLLSHKTVTEVFDTFFLQSETDEGLCVLITATLNNSMGIKLQKCVSLIEEFLRRDKMNLLLWNQCHVDGTSSNAIQDELLSAIASFPEKMANKLQGQNSDLFLPATYIPIVCRAIMFSLKKTHTSLTNSQDCSLEFISQLIGKMCSTGYADAVWSHLLEELTNCVRHDYIWRRICQRVITGVPDRCQESVLIPILKQLSWYGLVDQFLGDCILKKAKIQYLITTKILLLRYFDQVLLLQNVLGYLATSHTRRHLLIKCFRSLLEVWCDGSALKHTSQEQHLYITRALLICLGFLQDKDRLELKSEVLNQLMMGMQHHLNDPDESVRKVGMLLAETITAMLDPTGPKLTFEYTKDSLVSSLLALTVPPPDPGAKKLDSDMKVDVTGDISTLRLSDEVSSLSLSTPHITNTAEEEDLDSDDDLVPYYMSADVKVTAKNTPKYIRDCMEGLINQDAPERLEACLTVAETLIMSNPDGLHEIAVEFTKILLYLSENEAIPDFLNSRFKAMVALTIYCPKEVATYLTHEFYEKNYNLRQRLDMLQVLTAAAQELSRPHDKNRPSVVASATPNKQELDHSAEPETWQDIVQQRIAKKTRRFGKGRSHPEPEPVANRFAPHAGCFFFPLLQSFDRKEATFDMLGSDCLVLTKLVYSLGVITHSAVNAPVARQMCASLLEFLWVLRYHSISSVRQAVLFAMAMAFMTLPNHTLLGDPQTDVMETRDWLQDVVENDPSTECKNLAIQVLLLLDNIFKGLAGDAIQ